MRTPELTRPARPARVDLNFDRSLKTLFVSFSIAITSRSKGLMFYRKIEHLSYECLFLVLLSYLDSDVKLLISTSKPFNLVSFFMILGDVSNSAN